MVAYTNPPAAGSVKNYTVLDLNKEPEDVRDGWLRSVGELRYWCFNSTNNRFMFGSEAHRSAMIPAKGHFYIYLLYDDNCICLVIEGSTLYLVGFITSSVGGKDERQVWEMSSAEVKETSQYIEGAKKVKAWFGSYKNAENVQVGCGPLRSSFRGIFKYARREGPGPLQNDLNHWCDTFVIHFPEAARYDSLALCSIYHRFLYGGKVGSKQVSRAQNWSSDCRGALLQMTPVEIDESEGKKKAAKKKERLSVENTDLVVKRSQSKTPEEVQTTLRDIRLFYRPGPCCQIARLSSMPFQLDNGQVLGNFPENSREEAENMQFLMESVHGFSHDDCDYEDGQWTCKGLCAPQKESSPGLYNLGNTSYMNSTLQCLHSVPELKSSLLSYKDAENRNHVDPTYHNLTLAIHDVFNDLDQSFQPVAPTLFLKALIRSHPPFSHQLSNDAQKCWMHMMNTLSETLRTRTSEFTAPGIKELFGIDLVTRLYCEESEEEYSEDESMYSLKCHISQDVDNIHDGLDLGLKREVNRPSKLGRSAIYTGEAKIHELPRYLTVTLERLTWNQESNNMEKILRKVEYPVELDVKGFCSDELKQRLFAARQFEGSCSGTIAQSSNMNNNNTMPSVPKKQLTGVYNLFALVTHTHSGSGDDGHYVSWVKQGDGNWVSFDDINTTLHNEQHILELSGGGEDHTAYICLYKGQFVE